MTIAVNRNLSNCEIARKKVFVFFFFSGFQRDSNLWPLRSRCSAPPASRALQRKHRGLRFESHWSPEKLFFGLFCNCLLKLWFTTMVTCSFHLYSRSSHHFILWKDLINKHFLQVSGLCGTPFLSYLPKSSTQWGTPTWRMEITENIWNSLLLWERLLFPCELVCIHINTSTNTLTVQTAKNRQSKKDLFDRRLLCHSAILMKDGRNLENSRCYILNSRDVTYWAGNLW